MEPSSQQSSASALDLVEEFRLLDEMADQGNMENRRLGDFSEAHFNGCSPERSIGGADLSDILAPDDDDGDLVEFAIDITNNAEGRDVDPSNAAGKASNATTAATAVMSSPPYSSGSVWKEVAGNCLARGDDLALQRETGDSEAWNSEDDCREAAVSIAGGGDSDVSIDGEGGLGVLCEPENSQRAVGGSSALDDCRNPNVSAPMRPAEEGSDWDCAASQSSDDVDSECSRSRVDANHGSRWSGASDGGRVATKTFPLPSPSTTGVTSPLSECGEDKIVVVGTASETGRSSSRGVSAHYRAGMGRPQPDQRASPLRGQGERRSCKLRSSKLVEADVGKRQSDDDAQGYEAPSVDVAGVSGGTLAGTTSAAAAAAADTIEMLQAELRHLKEHVLRSEQRREEQLRELDSRLEVQEKRNGPPTARAHAAERVAFEMPEGGHVALVEDGVVEARRPRYKDGIGTPQGAAFHNPFAATGGAATPRDHFPAFEDALHDGEEGGTVQLGLDREDEEANKSLMQSEAFDFSIDTLSHINNHTDFGTEAPAGTPAGATSAASRHAHGESKGGGVAGRRESTRKYGPVAERLAPGTSFGLQVGQEAEEVFDAKDTAAEEAFFADAFATASLQTPVKHVHGTGAGFAVRRVRPDGRPARGTPAERAGTLLSPKVTESQQGVRNALHGRPPPGVGAFGQSCSVRRESSCPGSPKLCMAEFFARASAELGDSEDEVGGAAATSPIHAIGGRNSLVLRPGVERSRPRGVDAESQTTWSFSAFEGVRFVSTPVRTPLKTLMADGRDARHRTDGADWRFGCGLEGKARTPPSTGAGGVRSSDGKADGRDGRMDLHAHPYDGRPPCYTPRRSSQPLWQTPRRISQRDRDEPLMAGVSSISERSALFNSPSPSPVADARKRRPRPAPACGIDGLEGGGAHGRGAGGDGGGEGSVCQYGGGDAACIGGRRRKSSVGGHGLSPILSEGGGSGTSISGEAYRAFAVRESASSAGGAAVLSEVGSSTEPGWRMVREGGRMLHPSDGGCKTSREVDGEARESASCAKGARVARPVSPERPLDAPLFLDSSVDVTRSSLLRSSTTLHSIAPLGDVTGRSMSFHARNSGSFPGELFVDSRLPTCSATAPLPRYEDSFLQRGRVQRGDGATCAPSQKRRHFSQRGSGSAPTLPSQRSADSRFRAERLSGKTAGEPSLESRGIPPSVVGAWLAAAIDGIYGHNASESDGRNLLDQRTAGDEGTSSGGRGGLPAAEPVPNGLNLVSAWSPLVDDRGRRDKPTAPPAEARARDIHDKDDRYDYPRAVNTLSRVADYGDDSSPPPPPPHPHPSTLLHLGAEDEVGSDGGDGANEEELFYERQKLLQRVSSAAASHERATTTGGGGLASLAGGYASEDGRDRVDEAVDTMQRGSRRHSDPLSWKTPVVPSAAAAGGAAGGSEASARAWAGMGTSSYLRRQTSGYWRDRLGMTQ